MPLTDTQITVLTKPKGCYACVNTKIWLTERDIPFTEIDATTDAGQELVELLGIQQAPAVFINLDPATNESEQQWTGHRTDYLNAMFPASQFPVVNPHTAARAA